MREGSGLLLDFDGTLVELGPHPDEVRLESQVFEGLLSLAQREPVWLCSGRSLEDLSRKLTEAQAGLGGGQGDDWRLLLGLVGSHGLEWRFPLESWTSLARSGPPLAAQGERVSARWSAWREETRARLERLLEQEGLWLEEKRVSVTLHLPAHLKRGELESSLQRADAQRECDRIAAAVRLLEDDRVAVLPGKGVFNFVERGHSKGRAVKELILDGYPGITSLDVLGDEETDETIFRLREQDPRIRGWRVGEGETAAEGRLPDVAAVHQWLEARLRARISGGR